MKIHLLQTDKPSRLYEDVDGDLQLGYDFIVRQGMLQNQHIYITNDEKPKEGDWRLDETFKPVNLWFYPEKLKGKIILTTDQDLIADGVQEIDDEFLEWFVKNPSCEEVDTIIEYKDGYGNWFKYDKEFWDKMGNKPKFGTRYKIIIPKEEPTISEEAKERAKNYMSLKGALEPKQIKCYCGHTTYCDCSPLEEPKKETLEEAALNIIPDKSTAGWIDSFSATERIGFIKGAKWQQEQDKNKYSEEEVFKIIDRVFHMYASSYRQDAKEWFEQFKKK